MRSQARSEGYQGLSRRYVIAIMGAASGAIAVGYSTAAKAASDRSAIAIEDGQVERVSIGVQIEL